MKKLNIREIVILSLLISIAAVLSYIESAIGLVLPIPYAKIGLTNIAIVFALYTLGWQYAIVVSGARLLLTFLMFPNAFALLYSILGAVISLSGMILVKKVNVFSTVGVSVVGGILHNIGQIIAACLVMQTLGIATYLVPLAVAGTIAGVLIGIVCGILVNRISKYIKL